MALRSHGVIAQLRQSNSHGHHAVHKTHSAHASSTTTLMLSLHALQNTQDTSAQLFMTQQHTKMQESYQFNTVSFVSTLTFLMIHQRSHFSRSTQKKHALTSSASTRQISRVQLQLVRKSQFLLLLQRLLTKQHLLSSHHQNLMRRSLNFLRRNSAH